MYRLFYLKKSTHLNQAVDEFHKVSDQAFIPRLENKLELAQVSNQPMSTIHQLLKVHLLRSHLIAYELIMLQQTDKFVINLSRHAVEKPEQSRE